MLKLCNCRYKCGYKCGYIFPYKREGIFKILCLLYEIWRHFLTKKVNFFLPFSLRLRMQKTRGNTFQMWIQMWIQQMWIRICEKPRTLHFIRAQRFHQKWPVRSIKMRWSWRCSALPCRPVPAMLPHVLDSQSQSRWQRSIKLVPGAIYAVLRYVEP